MRSPPLLFCTSFAAAAVVVDSMSIRHNKNNSVYDVWLSFDGGASDDDDSDDENANNRNIFIFIVCFSFVFTKKKQKKNGEKMFVRWNVVFLAAVGKSAGRCSAGYI